MPKKKYLYSKKKQYYNGLNQEELDQVFFNSPKYAEMIGKKFGRSTKAVEDAFVQYFKVLKNLGITELIDPKQAKGNMDSLTFSFEKGMESNTLASTDVLFNTICIKNSFSLGDIYTLFHEFSHSLSTSFKVQFSRDKTDPYEKWVTTGYNKMNLDKYFIKESGPIETTDDKIEIEINGETIELTPEEFINFDFCLPDDEPDDEAYLYFSEAVTEYLTTLCLANLYKRPIPIGSGYAEMVRYIHSLYLTCGNSVFKGYFNDGNFLYMAEAFIGNKEEIKAIEKEIEDIAYLIELFDQEYAYILSKSGDSLEMKEAIANYVDLDLQIQKNLLELFSRKMVDEVILHAKEFKNSDEIFISLFNAYTEYGKNLTFGFNNISLLNLNRKAIFQNMCLSLAETIENLTEISLDKTRSKLLRPEDIEKLEGIDNANFAEFEILISNMTEFCKSNYATIPYDTKPISPVNYLHGRKVEFADKYKNSYERRKSSAERIGRHPQSIDEIWSTKYYDYLKSKYDLEEPDLFEELKAQNGVALNFDLDENIGVEAQEAQESKEQ